MNIDEAYFLKQMTYCLEELERNNPPYALLEYIFVNWQNQKEISKNKSFLRQSFKLEKKFLSILEKQRINDTCPILYDFYIPKLENIILKHNCPTLPNVSVKTKL